MPSLQSTVDHVRRRRGWVSKGFWAITDQALFALSNFVVSVLLARWLPQRDYGAFAVAFSVLLLMGAAHTALLTEPMLVFGPSRYRDRVAQYVCRLARLHLFTASGMSVALLLVVLALAVVQRSTVGATLVALAVSAPAILFLWLMRRACYIESRPRLSATAGLAYALMVPAGILLLEYGGMLTAASGLVIVGMASLLVAWRLKVRLVRSSSDTGTRISSRDLTHSHWSYGRWALSSQFFSWVPTNVVVLVLPLWHSLNDAGTLRVATTLMLPVLHMQGALTPLILPALVRARSSGDLRSNAVLAGALLISLGAVYGPLILMFGSDLAKFLFGTQYRIGGATLWLLAATPLISAVSGVAHSVLRALERPDRVLWTYVAASAVTCLVGLPLIFSYSVNGALTSMLLSAATTAILGTLASRRLTAHLSAIGGSTDVAASGS